MKPISRLTMAIVVAGIFVLVPGGCPADPAQLDALRPVPGVYWVALQDEQLYYFEFPQQRAQPGQWIALADDGEWFEGTGFYQLADDLTWWRHTELDGLTLDEVIQLYDPAPAVPDSEDS